MGDLSNKNRKASGRGKGDGDMDTLAQLIRAAGPREPVPAERAKRVKRAVKAEWRGSVNRRHRRRVLYLAPVVGLAAMCALAFYMGWFPGNAHPEAETVAVLERAVGDVSLLPATPDRAAASRITPELNQEIAGGSALQTGDSGRAAVMLQSGASLRVDANSHIVLMKNNRVELKNGAVYVDTARSKMEQAVEIETEQGRIRDIGTQFEVRQKGDAVRIRVRDGKVFMVAAGKKTFEAGKGTELAVDLSGKSTKNTIDLAGAEWAWVAEISPAFSMEDRTAAEYLEWVRRETHRPIRFAHPDMQEAAERIRLHGQLPAVLPEETLDIVLPVCGWTYSRDGDAFLIKPDAD